jgi:hypothetical protein
MSDRADWLEYLSKLRANEGDAMLALNTQQAADILRLEETLSARGDKLGIGVFDFSMAPAPLINSAREVHEAFREGLLDFVVTDAKEAVKSSWAAIDHLGALRMPTGADVAAKKRKMFAGENPRDYRAARAEYAKNADALSRAYLGAGQQRDAFRAAYRSDLAHFEGHLIDLAMHSGDIEFLSVGFRMELAKEALARTPVSEDIGTYRTHIRNALSWATCSREPLTWQS